MLHDLPWEVHALAVRKHAALLHGTDDIVAFDLLHGDFDQSIIDQDLFAHRQFLRQLVIAHADPFLIAHDLIGGQDERVAFFQFDLMVFKSPETILRPLGVQHDRQRDAQFGPDFFQCLDLLQMLLMRTVRKVQPGGIHACLTHRGQHFLAFACRPDRADDLCFSHNDAP